MKIKSRQPMIALLNIIQDKLLNSTRSRRVFQKLIKIFLSNPSVECSLEEEEIVDKVKSNGIAFLPKLDSEEISSIVSFAKTADLYDPWSTDGISSPFTYATRPKNVKTARVVLPMRCQLVGSLARDKNILHTIHSLFGSSFVIDSVDLWWSFPTDEDAAEAELYHRDTDSTEFYKYFIYLTDVTALNGPHVYVQNSHKNTNAFFSHERFSDSDIENVYGKQEGITGDAGTRFIANTIGLHKGLKPKSGERLLLQFRYSLHGSSFRYRREGDGKAASYPAVRHDYLA